MVQIITSAQVIQVIKWILSPDIIPTRIDLKIKRSTTLSTQDSHYLDNCFKIICKVTEETIIKILFV